MIIRIIASCKKLFFSEDVIFICFLATLVITLFTLLFFTKTYLIVTILFSILMAYIGVAIFMKTIYPIIQRNKNFTFDSEE